MIILVFFLCNLSFLLKIKNKTKKQKLMDFPLFKFIFRSSGICRQCGRLQKHHLKNASHPHRRWCSPARRFSQVSLPLPRRRRPGGPLWRQSRPSSPRIRPQVHGCHGGRDPGAARFRESLLVSADQKRTSLRPGHRRLLLPEELQPRHQPARGGPGHSRRALLGALRHAQATQRQSQADPAAVLPTARPHRHSGRGRLGCQESPGWDQDGHWGEAWQQLCAWSQIQVNNAAI